MLSIWSTVHRFAGAIQGPERTPRATGALQDSKGVTYGGLVGPKLKYA